MTSRRSRNVSARLPVGIRPREDYGQNFLMSREILERSCEYARLGPEDSVLEIGPGIGSLTEQLALRAGRVRAIEIDRQFETPLARLARRFDNLEIVWGDALKDDFGAFDKVVSNLPYKPALPLILKLLEHEFDVGVLIVQHRLARRLSARPGGKGYSRISVTVQRVASLRLLEIVKPHHFIPAPAVDSAMLRIRKIRARFPIAHEQRFRRLLETLFLQRERSVERALERLGRIAGSRIASQLPERLARQKVSQLSPEEFGLIVRRADEMGLTIPAVPEELKRKAQKFF